MGNESFLNQDELDSLIQKVWLNCRDAVLKQVEYSVAQELSARARTRSSQLIRTEIDAILKPKLASLRDVMEAKATSLMERLPKIVETAVADSIRSLISYGCFEEFPYPTKETMRRAVLKALDDERASTESK